MTTHYLLALCVLVTVAPNTWAFRNGAPAGACESLFPQHGVASKTSAAPYQLTLDRKCIPSGGSALISIQGNTAQDKFKGFIMQARIGDTPIGQFELDPSRKTAQTLNCGASRMVSV